MMHHLVQQFGFDNIIYVIFILTVGIFLIADLVILQRSDKVTSLKSATIQTLCWVSVSLIFCGLLYFYEGHETGTQYLSAYLTEYSLSADNVFVFILILKYFNLSEKYYHKVLFYGIIFAVLLRLIFILVGITLVNNFHWILYIFGVILVYTGITMLLSKEESKFEPQKNFVYRILNKYFNFTHDEAGGRLRVKRNGINYFTMLFLVIAIIASTDLIFAIDSIPAVFAISQKMLVVITSNIFAVMGLRAMFFLLQDMIKKFDYLHEGISIILIFIGIKMLLEIINFSIPTWISLLVIVIVLFAAVTFSLVKKK